MGENFYSINVVKLVEKIYGQNSDIYKLMNNGEKISSLIKADIKKKGKTKGAYQNFKGKKELYSLANMEEAYKELEDIHIKNGLIN